VATRALDSGLWAAARAVINTGFAVGRSLERRQIVSLAKKKKSADEDFFVERLVFTAVLDKNTCDPCADADGIEFDADSQKADIFATPYYLCEGGENCRCQLIAVDEAADLRADLIEHLALVTLDAIDDRVDLDSESAYRAWETRFAKYGRREPAIKITDHGIAGAIALAALTPEERSEIARRAWDVRGRGEKKEPGHNITAVDDQSDAEIVREILGSASPEDVANAMLQHTDKQFAVEIQTEGRAAVDPDILREEYDEYVERERERQEDQNRREYVGQLGERDDEIQTLWDEVRQEEEPSPYGDVSQHPLLPGIERPPTEKEKVPLADLIADTNPSAAFTQEEKDLIKERLRGTGGPEPWDQEKAEDVFREWYRSEGEEPDVYSFERWAEREGHDIYGTGRDQSVIISARADDGTNLTRKFTRNESGELSVDHAYFKVPEDQQGSGLAKAIMRGSFDEYERLGVDQVTVHANIDVGGYAWARFGFKPNNPDLVARLLHRRIDGLPDLTVGQRRALERLVDEGDDVTAIWRIADTRIGEREVGKEILKDQDWYGTLRMDDREATDRLHAYVTAPSSRRRPGTAGATPAPAPLTKAERLARAKAFLEEQERVHAQRAKSPEAVAAARAQAADYERRRTREEQKRFARERAKVKADEEARRQNRARLGLAPIHMAADDPESPGGHALFYIDKDGKKQDAGLWDELLGDDILPTDTVIPEDIEAPADEEEQNLAAAPAIALATLSPEERSDIARRAWDVRGRAEKQEHPDKGKNVTDFKSRRILNEDVLHHVMGDENLRDVVESMIAGVPGNFEVEVATAGTMKSHEQLLDEYDQFLDQFEAAGGESPVRRPGEDPERRGTRLGVPAMSTWQSTTYGLASPRIKIYADSDDGTSLERTLFRDDDGKLVVKHDIFLVPKGQQGTGIAKTLVGSSFDEYERLGVDRVQVQANIDVGAYAWAKFGFKPDDPDHVNRRLNQWATAKVLTGQLSGLDVGHIDAAIRNGDPETAIWRVADLVERDRRPGKELLTGRNHTWDGTIHLNDRVAMKRLRDYVATRTAVPKRGVSVSPSPKPIHAREARRVIPRGELYYLQDGEQHDREIWNEILNERDETPPTVGLSYRGKIDALMRGFEGADRREDASLAPRTLTPQEIRDAELRGWQATRAGLTKRYVFPNRRASAAFTSALYEYCNTINHHPDVRVDGDRVTVTYLTHATNTITDRDVEGARTADELAAKTPEMALNLALFDVSQADHKGLLVSLPVDPETARSLAVPGGVPPEDMHITVCYCGPVDELGDITTARAIAAVGDTVRDVGPLTGMITKLDQFPPTPQSDDQHVLIARVDIPELPTLRDRLVAALTQAGAPPRQNFAYEPHITIGYSKDPARLQGWTHHLRPVLPVDQTLAFSQDDRK
jgi:pterin-4a-carbinolamine dehydratase/2'-5' RNA ligase